jgi:hypothetical protein
MWALGAASGALVHKASYGSPAKYLDGQAVTKDGSPVTVPGIGVDPADSTEHDSVRMLVASWFFESLWAKCP